MTSYRVIKEKDDYLIEIEGHADYAQKGYDIVCAGISMAVSMTINLFDKFEVSYNIKKQIIENGHYLIETNMSDSKVITIMDNLVDCLQTLEKKYPNNIKYVK